MNPTDSTPPFPYLGFGLRLRTEYLQSVIEEKPQIDYIEVITENYLNGSETHLQQLGQLKQRYPIILHGISLSIGSPWPLDQEYLRQLKTLINRIEPAWISDHLCWKGADNGQGSLLPLPYSPDTLEHVVSRIQQVQEFLGRQILLENVPVEQQNSQEIPEAEFIREVAERSDSLILIDIGNLHSSSLNQGFSASDYIEQLPIGRVQQVHLPEIIFQSEPQDKNSPPAQISDPIWGLYTRMLDRFGRITTMIEREDTIPTLEVMLGDIGKIRRAVERYRQTG